MLTFAFGGSFIFFPLGVQIFFSFSLLFVFESLYVFDNDENVRQTIQVSDLVQLLYLTSTAEA